MWHRELSKAGDVTQIIANTYTIPCTHTYAVVRKHTYTYSILIQRKIDWIIASRTHPIKCPAQFLGTLNVVWIQQQKHAAWWREWWHWTVTENSGGGEGAGQSSSGHSCMTILSYFWLSVIDFSNVQVRRAVRGQVVAAKQYNLTTYLYK